MPNNVVDFSFFNLSRTHDTLPLYNIENILQNLKNVYIYMKDTECAETNEKSIFRFLRFLLSEIGFFFKKLVNFPINFEYKIDHNPKNNDRKNRKKDFAFVSAQCACFL